MSLKIDADALRKAIEDANAKWSSAVNSGKASAIEDCLDEDVISLSLGTPGIHGKAAVVAEVETWVNAGTTNGRLLEDSSLDSKQRFSVKWPGIWMGLHRSVKTAARDQI